MPQVKGSSRMAQQRLHTHAPVPGRTQIYSTCEAVLAVLANVDAGMYPYPPITMDHYLP